MMAGLALVCTMCVLGFGGSTGEKQYVDVILSHSGRTVHLTALHDTGNTLRDPVTGERIVVAGAASAHALLGLEYHDLLDPVGTMESGICPGARLIPYRAVGLNQGFLLGYRFCDGLINGKKASVLVAFTAQGLGEGKGEFDALIGGVV